MRAQAQGKCQPCAVPDPFLLFWSRMAANTAQGKRSLVPVNQSRLWASGAPAGPILCDQANAPRADWLMPPLLDQSSEYRG